MTAAAKKLHRPGDVVPLEQMDQGAYAELVGATVRYEDGDDIPIFCARVRVSTQLRFGTLVTGWIESRKSWGEVVGAPAGAMARLVSAEDAAKWGRE